MNADMKPYYYLNTYLKGYPRKEWSLDGLIPVSPENERKLIRELSKPYYQMGMWDIQREVGKNEEHARRAARTQVFKKFVDNFPMKSKS
jgi:hypothetical protein